MLDILGVFAVTTPCTTACQFTDSLLRVNEACFTVFQRQLFLRLLRCRFVYQSIGLLRKL